MDVLHSVKVLFLGTNDQFETARRNDVVSLFPVFVRSAAVYKFLHVLKETHYRYNSIRINQNSLSTHEMDNFGAELSKLLKFWTM